MFGWLDFRGLRGGGGGGGGMVTGITCESELPTSTKTVLKLILYAMNSFSVQG